MMSFLPRCTHAPNSSTSIICKNISKQVNINIYNQIGGRNERQKLKRVFFSRDGMIKRRPKWENKRDHKRQERCECVCVRQRNWCGNYHAIVAGSSKLKKKKERKEKSKESKSRRHPHTLLVTLFSTCGVFVWRRSWHPVCYMSWSRTPKPQAIKTRKQIN